MITRMDTRPDVAPSPAPRRHRLRNSLVAGAAVVVLLIAALVYLGLTREPQAPVPAVPAGPEMTIAPPPQITVPEDRVVAKALPDGCLGGPDPRTAVLVAQQQAELSDKGAAEFALAVTRWIYTVPYGPDMTAQVARIMMDPGPWLDRLAAEENPFGGYRLVNPEAFSYEVLSNDGDVATVAVSVDRQHVPAGDGSLVTARLTSEWVLASRDGVWTVRDTSAPTTVGSKPYFAACS